MTIAHHSSSRLKEAIEEIQRVILTFPRAVYFSGDTDLFMEMELYGRQGIDIGF